MSTSTGVDPYGTGGHVPSNIWTGGHYHECPLYLRSTSCNYLRLFMTFWYVYLYLCMLPELLIAFFMQCIVCVYGLVLTVCALMVKTNSIFELILAIDVMTFSFT